MQKSVDGYENEAILADSVIIIMTSANSVDCPKNNKWPGIPFEDNQTDQQTAITRKAFEKDVL
jgi:hypothetical protein